jgi:hypothetical protein
MSLYIAKSSAIAARSLDDEMIVMSAHNSMLFTLNEVAAAIWNAADGRTPLSQIVQDSICDKFATEPGAAYADAEEFCRRLAEHGVLILSTEPIEQQGA